MGAFVNECVEAVSYRCLPKLDTAAEIPVLERFPVILSLYLVCNVHSLPESVEKP
jgi:hypothetical protein